MAKNIIYKITEQQSIEIQKIGNQTGFHWIPMDYGFGFCLPELPIDSGYDIYKQFISDNGLQPFQIDINLEQSGRYSFTEINQIQDVINVYDKRVQEAKDVVIEHTIDKLQEDGSITPEETKLCAAFYSVWKVGEVVNDALTSPNGKADIRQYNGVLYKAIQPHTTQLDWTPDLVPTLWVQVNAPDVILVWKQPTGAHDAYQVGDKVHFPTATDPVYRSKIDANVWSPTEYPQGWEKL